MYLNSYRCPNCWEEWDDTWTYPITDRCPKCSSEIEPYMSIDLEKEN